MKTIKYYKFRAECMHDVIELMKRMNKKEIQGMIVRELAGLEVNGIRTVSFPDVTVQINTFYKLETLRNIMRSIEDGHVMVQTLCHKEEYNGERDKDTK